MYSLKHPRLISLLSIVLLFSFSCDREPQNADPEVDFIEYDSNKGDIGAGGGKIIVTDPESELYGVGVDIPPGALEQTQQISFSIAEGVVPPTDSLATVINMEPSGLVFSEPISIYLPYKETDEPTAYYYNPDSAYLELVEVVQNNPSEGIVEIKTDHFSQFFVGKHGVYVDAELFYINNKVRCQLQFGGNYRDIKFWTGGIQLRSAPIIFGGLQYWNALDFLESANPIGTYNNHCYVTIEVELRRLRVIGSEFIENETYSIQRIGSSEGNYSAVVHKRNNAGGFEHVYETGILTRDELDIYFSGKALAIDFDANISSDKEYFIETSWVLSDNIKGMGSPLGYRWTDKYSVSTRLKDDGVWDISLMYRADQDKNGNSIVDEFEKDKGDPPVADFEASYTSITKGGTIDFTDLSTNDPTSWSWDFGDGGSSTSQNPSHTYSSVGTYTVSLTVTNEHGSDTETKEDYIIIVSDGQAPFADFKASYTSISEGGTIEFTDLSTGNPINWSWNFGDGSSSNTQNPSHSYSSVGTYTVTLTVSNEHGSDTEIKEDYIIVVSEGAAPIADFEASPTSIPEGGTIDFTDLSTNNPTSWSWDFGDGSNSTEQNPTHSYSVVGKFTVTLTVTNAHGSDDETKTDYITVSAEVLAPVAEFSATPTTITEGGSVQFTDQSTNVPTEWLWDFGDGSTSTSKNPSHTYSSKGTFDVSLTVTNSAGSNSVTMYGYIIVSRPDITGQTGILSDSDGNIYNWVGIGQQAWMVENLKTTKYNDGSDISLVTNDYVWDHLTTPGYCWYNNNETNYKDTYGALYNWYTVNTDILCPVGWHVPTDAEWTELENYLIANGYNYDGTTLGDKIGKSLASTSGWETSSEVGNVGNDQSDNNTTGFSALPGGTRFLVGDFKSVGHIGMWWSSTEFSVYLAGYRILSYNHCDLERGGMDKDLGFSVRCLRD